VIRFEIGDRVKVDNFLSGFNGCRGAVVWVDDFDFMGTDVILDEYPYEESTPFSSHELKRLA
jgi:hypothetical protein